MHNVLAVCGGQPSPYELRFGEPFVVKKMYPFGAKIFYKLMLEDANAKGRKFERKAAEGIFQEAPKCENFKRKRRVSEKNKRV